MTALPNDISGGTRTADERIHTALPGTVSASGLAGLSETARLSRTPLKSLQDGTAEQHDDQGINPSTESLDDQISELDVSAARLALSFFHRTSTLGPMEICPFLGSTHPLNALTLKYYMAQYDFRDVSLVDALRFLCSNLWIGGETQVIDRVLWEFGKRYMETNAGDDQKVFGSTSSVQSLGASLPSHSNGPGVTGIAQQELLRRASNILDSIPTSRDSITSPDSLSPARETHVPLPAAAPDPYISSSMRSPTSLRNLHSTPSLALRQAHRAPFPNPPLQPSSRQPSDRHLNSILFTFGTCNHDIIYALTFSLILLNTDLHKADAGGSSWKGHRRMKKSEFVRNTMEALVQCLQDHHKKQLEEDEHVMSPQPKHIAILGSDLIEDGNRVPSTSSSSPAFTYPSTSRPPDPPKRITRYDSKERDQLIREKRDRERDDRLNALQLSLNGPQNTPGGFSMSNTGHSRLIKGASQPLMALHDESSSPRGSYDGHESASAASTPVSSFAPLPFTHEGPTTSSQFILSDFKRRKLKELLEHMYKSVKDEEIAQPLAPKPYASSKRKDQRSSSIGGKASPLEEAFDKRSIDSGASPRSMMLDSETPESHSPKEPTLRLSVLSSGGSRRKSGMEPLEGIGRLSMDVLTSPRSAEADRADNVIIPHREPIKKSSLHRLSAKGGFRNMVQSLGKRPKESMSSGSSISVFSQSERSTFGVKSSSRSRLDSTPLTGSAGTSMEDRFPISPSLSHAHSANSNETDHDVLATPTSRASSRDDGTRYATGEDASAYIHGTRGSRNNIHGEDSGVSVTPVDGRTNTPSPFSQTESTTDWASARMTNTQSMENIPTDLRPDGSLPDKSGVLIRKVTNEQKGKKAANRHWRQNLVVLDGSDVKIYKMIGASGRFTEAGQTRALKLTDSFSLLHSLSKVFTGGDQSSSSRRHVFSVSLSDGSVHLFQCGDDQERDEWVQEMNYWAARESRPPVYGGWGNHKYGWEDDALAHPDQVKLHDYSPPETSNMKSDGDVTVQLQSWQQYLDSFQTDLQSHIAVMERVRSAFAKSSSSKRDLALENWRQKLEHLNFQVHKYQNYANALTARHPEVRSSKRESADSVNASSEDMKTSRTTQISPRSKLSEGSPTQHLQKTATTENGRTSAPIVAQESTNSLAPPMRLTLSPSLERRSNEVVKRKPRTQDRRGSAPTLRMAPPSPTPISVQIQSGLDAAIQRSTESIQIEKSKSLSIRSRSSRDASVAIKDQVTSNYLISTKINNSPQTSAREMLQLSMTDVSDMVVKAANPVFAKRQASTTSHRRSSKTRTTSLPGSSPESTGRRPSVAPEMGEFSPKRYLHLNSSDSELSFPPHLIAPPSPSPSWSTAITHASDAEGYNSGTGSTPRGSPSVYHKDFRRRSQLASDSGVNVQPPRTEQFYTCERQDVRTATDSATVTVETSPDWSDSTSATITNFTSDGFSSKTLPCTDTKDDILHSNRSSMYFSFVYDPDDMGINSPPDDMPPEGFSLTQSKSTHERIQPGESQQRFPTSPTGHQSAAGLTRRPRIKEPGSRPKGEGKSYSVPKQQVQASDANDHHIQSRGKSHDSNTSRARTRNLSGPTRLTNALPQPAVVPAAASPKLHRKAAVAPSDTAESHIPRSTGSSGKSVDEPAVASSFASSVGGMLAAFDWDCGYSQEHSDATVVLPATYVTEKSQSLGKGRFKQSSDEASLHRHNHRPPRRMSSSLSHEGLSCSSPIRCGNTPIRRKSRQD